MPFRLLGCALLALTLLPPVAFSQTPLHQRIDALVAAKKKDFAKIAAKPADDAEFLRRAYLDLTGVTPAAAETREFLADKAPDKRAKLIDRLLASEGYARHFATVFDVLWMDRRAEKNVKRAEWLDFLRFAFAANKPYDQIVKDVLSNDGGDPKNRGAARFFLDRDAESHILTKDISRLFMGMNLHCAQCHDHPLVLAYRQEHYYGIYAFLNRTFVFKDKGSPLSVLAEKGDGDVTFQSVFVAKVTKTSGPIIPFGKAVSEPKLEKGKEYKVPFKPGEKPQPVFSRRAPLAQSLVENPQFARAAANRLWFQLLGRGIVHPVDLDHDANPPSHPEMLKALAEDLTARKFDVKGFLREIMLSQTYQRSSVSPIDPKDVNPADFAVAALKPLSPEEFAWSLMQGTGLIDAEKQALGPKGTRAALFAKLAGNEASFARLFGANPGEVADASFQTTLDQTLFLANGPTLQSWLAPRPGNLTFRLGQLKDDAAAADELYLTVLTRLPSPEERKEVVDFLTPRRDNRAGALQDLAWALLASAEFRFNH